MDKVNKEVEKFTLEVITPEEEQIYQKVLNIRFRNGVRKLKHIFENNSISDLINPSINKRSIAKDATN